MKVHHEKQNIGNKGCITLSPCKENLELYFWRLSNLEGFETPDRSHKKGGINLSVLGGSSRIGEKWKDTHEKCICSAYYHRHAA